MRHVDTRKREKYILHLVVESYIEETKPISSGYICRKYNLSCSTATVRSVMESLEQQGLLSHVHTSSGRVPTTRGFKQYVAELKQEEKLADTFPGSPGEETVVVTIGMSLNEFLFDTLDILSEMTGYTSLAAFEDKFFFRGTRFMLEQPEFGDISRLKSILYALEVKMNSLQQLLFNALEQDLNILIGDDIGCDEIADCSLVISGLRFNDQECGLALLGPVRMDYVKAASSLYSARHRLEESMKGIARDEA